MSTLREARATLVAVSRRYSRVAHEVEDLAHDLIVSALRRGAGLDADALLKSAHGAARRHGAFLARSAGRRRAREASSAHVGGEEVAHEAVEDDAEGGAPVSALSPALRTTLYLLLLGLEKAELRAVLGVSDAALRKRFQALREHGPLAPPALPVAERPPALRRSQVELLPQLAGGAPRILAAGDPDGHGIIFAEVLTESRPAATTEAPATKARTKGSPC